MIRVIIILCFVAISACAADSFTYQDGGIIRGPRAEKRIALEFSADEFTEGGTVVLDQLAAHHIHASFFLTGRCVRRPENADLIRRILRDGHYLGSHSDTHPLMCPWSGPKTNLVTQPFFNDEMQRSIDAIAAFGMKKTSIPYFIPPYEWYNKDTVAWSRQLHLKLINFTSGTRSTADYTEDAASNFVSSEKIMSSIRMKEAKDGLNGFLLLLHLGAGPKRTDKFFDHLGELIVFLQDKDYRCVRVDELLVETK